MCCVIKVAKSTFWVHIFLSAMPICIKIVIFHHKILQKLLCISKILCGQNWYWIKTKVALNYKMFSFLKSTSSSNFYDYIINFQKNCHDSAVEWNCYMCSTGCVHVAKGGGGGGAGGTAPTNSQCPPPPHTHTQKSCFMQTKLTKENLCPPPPPPPNWKTPNYMYPTGAAGHTCVQSAHMCASVGNKFHRIYMNNFFGGVHEIFNMM